MTSERRKKQQREAQRRYREKHPEKGVAYRKEYRGANPEIIREQKRRYYQKHKTTIRARAKAKWELPEVKEKVRAAQKKWRESNREKLKAYQNAYHKSYYEKNKERIQENVRKNYVKDRASGAAYRRHLAGHLRRKFGLKIEEYESILANQKNRCGICGQEEKRVDGRMKKVSRLCVDHCHKTGKIRKLLCSRCNMIIGAVNDDISILELAISYLRSFGA